MESSKILGILCRKCNHLMGLNDKNHICSETQPKKYTFQKIQTKDTSESSNTIPSKPCIISDFMAEIEQEEHSYTSISENIDDDDNEFYTNLISAIHERNPLWDHHLPMSNRYEPIKQALWNEIYVALNGIYPIEVLKKKWKYLREKYVREKKKPASGAAGGKKKVWCHMQSLHFLNDVITSNNKITSNIPSSIEKISHFDKEDNIEQRTKPTKRSKNDTFEDSILRELRESRPVTPSTNYSVEENPDLHFSKYLASLMKDIPKKKKLALQSNFICQVMNSLED